MDQQITDNRIKWIEALESGSYDQTKGTLKKIHDNGELIGFCCLGVAAEIFGLEVEGCVEGPYGLDEGDDEVYEQVKEKLSITNMETEVFISKNDNYDKSFTEIAAYARKEFNLPKVEQ